ncbi:hypothetical protein CRUP_034267, partial [Coryphaenoides rupestris]
ASCPLPHSYTTVVSNGNSSESSLSVRIFSFVVLDVIYLHCQVHICVEMGAATCVPELSLFHVVGFSVLGIAISLVFICGLTCVFFYQRNRIGHYNFSIKPKEDNFTFHAFDK